MAKERILIVEDENETAEFIKLLLEQEGYGVCGVVRAGEEAVDIALNTRPDLILMDIRLSGKIDGIVAFQRIKKSVQIPVIFVSADADLDMVIRAMQNDSSGYLVKPFKSEQLLHKVKASLACRKLRFGI